MRSKKALKIKRTVDILVAIMFATACAYPALKMLPPGPGSAGLAAGLFAFGYSAVRYTLFRLGGGRRDGFAVSPMPVFQPAHYLDDDEFFEVRDEPLERAQQLEPAATDARVVQLFGDSPRPTAGDLVVRIDQHLAARERSAFEGETGAMIEALHELRRNLR